MYLMITDMNIMYFYGYELKGNAKMRILYQNDRILKP